MRTKRRRRVTNNNYSYMVLILICLLVLNIGVLAFRIIKDKSTIVGSNYLTKIFSVIDVNDIIFWKTNKDNITEVSSEIPSTNELEDEDESRITEDYIIDRLEEYESLIIIKDSSGISTIENIPAPLNINKVKLDKEKPYILMYHTHASEAFLTDEKGIYHNSDLTKNIVSIGNVITKVLEANGNLVDHDETMHDLPSYNNSYNRSINTVNKKKSEQANLKFFLDIHRDGVDDDAEYKERFLKKARITINGVSTATFSLVIGPDTPNYDSVLSFAKYIKAVSDTLYPNLCTGIIIKPVGKYNLYASDYSALIEVGSNLVTLEEANESAKLVGEILSLVINSILE